MGDAEEIDAAAAAAELNILGGLASVTGLQSPAPTRPAGATAENNASRYESGRVFFVGSWERPTSQLRGKTGLASLNRFRPTSVGSQQGICTPYPNAAGFSGLGRHVEIMAEEKQDHVDEAACLYVADDLYDDLHSDNIILD